MKTNKKSYFIPTLYLLFLFSVTIGIYFTKKAYDNYDDADINDNITYVSSSILNRTIPIVNIPDTVKAPYSSPSVKIGREYYNKNDDIAQKEKEVVYYENTYMPNTGIDYVSDEIFDVLSIYDGTVIDVFNDELLGKSVQIRHNGELISVYQGIENIDVSKGDIVFTGQRIGTSGKSKLNTSLGNHLHFEIIKNGKTINPSTCIDKKLGDI